MGLVCWLTKLMGWGFWAMDGGGACEYFNVEKEVDIYVGTFSKSLGSIGGFVSAKARYSRVYST